MSENEDNFNELRRLLVLKRHETPPPGYFNHFSGEVLQRIRAGEAAEPATFLEQLFAPAAGLVRLVKVLEAKPVFASGFAGAVCLVLLFGIVHLERSDLTLQPMLPAGNTVTSLAALSPVALSQPASQIGIMSSTNPVLSLQAVNATFGQQNPLAQPVSFQVPNY